VAGKTSRNTYSDYWTKARLRHGWTQRQAAQFLSVQFQFVSAVERGLSRFTLAQVQRLMRRYKLSSNEVLKIILSDTEVEVRRAFARRK
jgi:transcriptional regulator with XRE-family HTH domain